MYAIANNKVYIKFGNVVLCSCIPFDAQQGQGQSRGDEGEVADTVYKVTANVSSRPLTIKGIGYLQSKSNIK